MDDNENFLDYPKMNFQPFTINNAQFANAIQGNSVNQFTTTKFAQNITNGQVVGLVSGADGGLQFLRPVESGASFHQTQTQTTQQSSPQTQTLITLPITMPGAKPGDAQQTVQIQVVNPNPIQHHQQTQKFQMSPMQIPLQGFQQGTTVLTVAYSPQDGEILQNHGLPDGMTVLAAIQPQDLQILAHAQSALAHQQAQANQQVQVNASITESNDEENRQQLVSTKQEPQWENSITTQTADLAEYFSRMPQGMPLNLHQFLKFNSDTIKRESQVENSPLNGLLPQNEETSQTEMSTQSDQQQQLQSDSVEVAGGKSKKKRKYKKKPPKPKRPKPGQVHIATALDGTILFCCPECQMAYPEKENLERHLSVHKIDRRFICDICGAGLKRKEHLDRHKLGHNPDRPYICSVCMKGFKRKEHLNLHYVIHSGEKKEICGECGKGFYRKDHLRKHAKSHAAKRLKEELNAQANANGGNTTTAKASKKPASLSNLDETLASVASGGGSTDDSSTTSQQQQQQQQQQGNQTTICLPEVTIHVPTSNNTTLPVQIQLPQLLTTSSPDGTTSTVVLPPANETILPH